MKHKVTRSTIVSVGGYTFKVTSMAQAMKIVSALEKAIPLKYARNIDDEYHYVEDHEYPHSCRVETGVKVANTEKLLGLPSPNEVNHEI